MNNATVLESTEVTTDTNLFKLFDASNTECLTDYNRTHLNCFKADFYAADEGRVWMKIDNINHSSEKQGESIVLFLNASDLNDRINKLDYSEFNNNDSAYSQAILDIALEQEGKQCFFQKEGQRKARNGSFSF